YGDGFLRRVGVGAECIPPVIPDQIAVSHIRTRRNTESSERDFLELAPEPADELVPELRLVERHAVLDEPRVADREAEPFLVPFEEPATPHLANLRHCRRLRKITDNLPVEVVREAIIKIEMPVWPFPDLAVAKPVEKEIFGHGASIAF